MIYLSMLNFILFSLVHSKIPFKSSCNKTLWRSFFMTFNNLRLSANIENWLFEMAFFKWFMKYKDKKGGNEDPCGTTDFTIIWIHYTLSLIFTFKAQPFTWSDKQSINGGPISIDLSFESLCIQSLPGIHFS